MRKRALKKALDPVYLGVFRGLQRFIEKTQPVIYKDLWGTSRLSETLKSALTGIVKAFVSRPGAVPLLGGSHLKGKTLNGRLDRCPPQFRAMLLQHSLQNKKYVFTLNFGPTETKRFLASSRGFTHSARLALNGALKLHLGFVPHYFYFVEVGPFSKVTPHGKTDAATDGLIRGV